MKKSIKNAITLLAAISVGCFILYGATLQKPETGNSKGNVKPERKPWVCPDKVAEINNPVTPQEGLLETGKKIWLSECKSCHGAKGRGDGVKADKIDVPIGDFASKKYQQAKDGELFWKATEGRKPMPSFKDQLSDIDRWCVIMYMRTFAQN